MFHSLRRRVLAIGAGTTALALALAWAPAAAAQGTAADSVHNASRLGGATAFYAPPLKSAASLKQLVARKGMAEDIRTVLSAAGIPETADAVLATLGAAAAGAAAGSCDEARPPDGTIVQCDFQPGSTLLWMALRPDAARGHRAPGRIERVRWAGERSFKALLFRVTNDDRIYTFVLPMVCSNLSLISVKEIEGEPVDVSVDRFCDPATGILRATVTARSRDLRRVQRVIVAVNGQPVGELSAPSWSLTTNKPGDYTFDAADTKGRTYPVGRRTLRVEACPQPPSAEAKHVVAPTCSVAMSFVPARRGYEITIDATRSSTGASGVAPAVAVDVVDGAGAKVGHTLALDDRLVGTLTVREPGTYRATATVSTPQGIEAGANRYEGSSTCEASVTVERSAAGGRAAFFVDVLAGKDRRVRPIEDTDLEFVQCSPLLGLKLGVAKHFRNDWEVAGAVGVGISLVTDDQKTRESELFVDAEVNRYVSGGSYIGTGISFWDLTRRDTWTPAWLLHFGVPLSRTARHAVYVVGEGRVFFDHIDDVANNYQIWGGIRVQFRR